MKYLQLPHLYAKKLIILLESNYYKRSKYYFHFRKVYIIHTASIEIMYIKLKNHLNYRKILHRKNKPK
jgi:hypothetical protein